MRRLAALAALALPLCACQATVRVGVAPKSNGSGDLSVAVVLDRQAAAALGDLTTAIPTADLEKAGWVIDKPVTNPGGGASETAHHPFRTVAEANALLATIAGGGAKVPFAVTLSHRSATLASHVAVTGAVDVSGGVDAFADDKLRQALGSPSLAAALDQAKQSGAAVPQITAELAATMPGHPTHVAGGKVRGDTVTWDVPLGQRMTIGATSQVTDTFAEKWLLVAGGFVVAFLLVMAVQFSRRNQWRFGDRHSVSRDFRGPGVGGRNRGHQDRWSLPTGPGSRR